MKVLVSSVMSHPASQRTAAYQAPQSMEFYGKDTGVGGHSLLQGILLTQGLNPDLPHCRQIVYHLSQQGSPEGPFYI